MKKQKVVGKTKRWLLIALAVAAFMVFGKESNNWAMKTKAATVVGQSITLTYDDRKNLASLVGGTPSQVNITNQNVTSKQVGSNIADTNVLEYENGTLYAVGTGTAKLNVDGMVYNVTVKKARLSLLMITGHSIAAGARGNAAQSVAVEAGQSYSTFFGQAGGSTELDVNAIVSTLNGGIGYGSSERVPDIDEFAPGRGGNRGSGSGIAYQWNQLTGEKLWVVNVARGGTCINNWVPGEYNHNVALGVFNRVQEIAKAEFAAGHFELGEHIVLYFNAANFSQYPGYTQDSLKTCYDQLIGSFRTNFNEDLDGDTNADNISIGFVPIWAAGSKQNLSHDKPISYYLSAAEEGMFVVSQRYREWVTEEGLSLFPAITYTTQSEPVYMPESVHHTLQGGTSENSIFCKEDKVHLQQVVYNAMGIDLADNLKACLRTGRTATETTLYDITFKQLSNVKMTVGQTLVYVPFSEPCYAGGLTIEATGAISKMSNTPWAVQADAEGTGTLTVKDGDKALAQAQFSVTAAHSHCLCVGLEQAPEGHVCEQGVWEAAVASGSMFSFTESGRYFLPGGSVAKSLAFTVPEGDTLSVDLCLNGTLLHANTPVNLLDNVTLRICDCKGSGAIKSHKSGNDGYAVRISNAGSTVELYSGTVGGVYSSLYNRSVEMTNGTFKMYGGVIANGRSDRGGNVLLTDGSPKFYLYGGTISGGHAIGETRCGGNVYMDAGQFWFYGGNITIGTTAISPSDSNYIYDQESSADIIHGAGGNVYLAGGEFWQYGGEISNGVAALSGGNIYVADGLYSLQNGLIADGIAQPTLKGYAKNAVGAGGNIYVDGDTAFFLRGGTITGGRASRYGGNIYTSDGSTLYLGKNNVQEPQSNTVNILDGNVTGAAMTKVNANIADSGSAYGGNIYSGGALWFYNGSVINGKAGLNTQDEKTAVGFGNGGNIYCANTAMIAGTVSDGIAVSRGNNVYVSSNAVLNLEGAQITDNATYAQKAAENVNINDAKTVKLIGDCQLLGGDYAIRICSVPATLPDTIASETPETGVWLDAMVDEETGEVLGSPVFSGAKADIVLVPTTEGGKTVNTYLCLYDGFQSAVSNYYYKDGKNLSGENVDNRISVKVEGASEDADYEFARKAITYTKQVTESTDGEGNPTTVTEYLYKRSTVRLSDMRYCFQNAEEQDRFIEVQCDPEVGATTPTTPEEAMKQWLVLAAYLDEVKVDGINWTMQDALNAYATGRGSAVTLLCQMDCTDAPLVYTGTRNLVINLAGYDLTAEFTMTKGAKLACIDSTTNDYNCYWEDDVKVKFGTLFTNSPVVKGATLTDGKLENSTSGDLEAVYKHNGRWYLRVAEGQNSNGVKGYSFHRIYMNLTGISIYPSTDGIAYSSAFLSNARVRNKLRDQGALCPEGRGFGIMMTVSGADVETNSMFVTYNKNSIVIPEGTEYGGAGEFTNQSLADLAYKTSRIDNFLAPTVDGEGNVLFTTEQKATTTLRLTPTVVLEDGTYLAVGNPVTRTYQEQIGKANAAWTAGQLSQSLQDAMYTMYRNYMDTMSQWEDQYVSNMRGRYYDESSVDKPLDNEQDGDPWA